MFKDIASKFAPVERVDSTESSKDRDREQEKLTRTEPNFSFSIESKKITIEYDSIIINTIRIVFLIFRIHRHLHHQLLLHGHWTAVLHEAICSTGFGSICISKAPPPPPIKLYLILETYISPNKSEVVALPRDKNSAIIPVPEQYHNANVMVSIKAQGLHKSKVYTLACCACTNLSRCTIRTPYTSN